MNLTWKNTLRWNAALILVIFAMVPVRSAWGSDNKSDEMAGAVLFRDKGCAHCHGANGAGTPKGPALANIRKDKLWTPDKIKDQILNGGKKMPPFADSLTDDEVGQIIDYLRAKHPPALPPASTNAQE